MNRRLPIIIATAVALGVSVISATMPSAQAATSSLTAAEQTAAALPAPAPIAWGPCSDQGLADAGAVCGFVSVPLDYNHPYGPKIKIAVSRIKHTVPRQAVPGHHADQPRRPRRLGPGPVDPRSSDRRPTASAATTTGSASTRAGSAAAVPSISCEPELLRRHRARTTTRVEADPASDWLHRTQAYARRARARAPPARC